MNNGFGITQVEIITPDEAKSLYPHLETKDLLGASWVPHTLLAQNGLKVGG